MKPALHLCDLRTPPTATSECMEAVGAEGATCESCPRSCYRQGWPRERVTEDNAELVRRRVAALNAAEFASGGAR